jgi:hypothetical protein
LRELLEAKQERTRQGPHWPPANAHTGLQHPAGTAGVHEGSDFAAVQSNSLRPAVNPESNLGTGGMHGRGNQGKRNQN